MRMCPHCSNLYNNGAIYNSHEKKCAKEHGVESIAGKGRRVNTRGRNVAGVRRNEDYLLWNRGEWRGWAVGRPIQRDARITVLGVTHFDHDLIWSTSALKQDVEEGRVFFVDPTTILEMLAEQVEGIEDEDERLTDAVEFTREAARMLREYKNDREND